MKRLKRVLQQMWHIGLVVNDFVTPKRSWLKGLLLFWPPAWWRGIKAAAAWVVSRWRGSVLARAVRHLRTKESWNNGLRRVRRTFGFLRPLRHLVSARSWRNGFMRLRRGASWLWSRATSLEAWKRGVKALVLLPVRIITISTGIVIALVYGAVRLLLLALWTIVPKRSWGKPIVALSVLAVVAVGVIGVYGVETGRIDNPATLFDERTDYAFSSETVAELSESTRIVQVVWGDSANGQPIFVRNHTGVVISDREILVSTQAFTTQLTQQEIDMLNAALESGDLVIEGQLTVVGAQILPSEDDRVRNPEIIDLSVRPAVHEQLQVASLRRSTPTLDVSPATFVATEEEIGTGAELFTVQMFEIPGSGIAQARVSQHVAEAAFNNFVFVSDADLGQPIFVLRDGQPELIGITSMVLDDMVVAANANPHLGGYFQRLDIDIDLSHLFDE